MAGCFAEAMFAPPEREEVNFCVRGGEVSCLHRTEWVNTYHQRLQEGL